METMFGDINVSGASDGYNHGDDYDEMDDKDEESNSADLSRKWYLLSPPNIGR